ncbi:MAG TPA: aldolase/citrate lyase family protein [Burkholderiaceae bacterium]|nr:aldolase/citrate lyase family protein [Burkholderiaceae bacterium]
MSAAVDDPRKVLFADGGLPPSIPVCDHYCGVEERMRKSLALQAELGPVFDVTFDCEDGAPVGREAEHVRMAVDLIGSSENRFDRVGARVHPLDHAAFDDDVDTLIRGAGARLPYLMVPKPRDLADAKQAIKAVDAACARRGVRKRPAVHFLIETHGALRDVFAIAALPRVQSLSFGLMDFVSAHNGAIPVSAMSAQGQFEHPLVRRAKLEIAAACHAAAKVPSHSVVTEFKHVKAVQGAAARAAHEFGFTRMWSIHPSQVQAIVDVFAPTVAELDEAIEIIGAAEAARWAPIRHRDTLHDRASYRYYWQVIERARRTRQPLPAEIERAWFGDPPDDDPTRSPA